MWSFNTGDWLIEVTIWAGLTIELFVIFVKRGKVHSNLNNIYLENNQKMQYIEHSKYWQDSETSNSVIIFCKHHASI